MWNRPELKQIGSLQALVREPSDKNSKKSLVIFHGYGANAYDLYSLAEVMDPEEKYRWVFPDGHQAAAGVPMGRQWFPIDIAALERAMQTGVMRQMSEADPPEIRGARQKAFDMIDALELDLKQTILGGFSQGSMLAIDMMLESQKEWAGLIAFSSTLLAAKRWTSLVELAPEFHFIQSHGQSDPLLAFDQAQDLYQLLSQKGHGDFVEFRGGHEIPPNVLQRAYQFVKSRLY